MIGRIFLILTIIVLTWLATDQVQLGDPSGLQEKNETSLPLTVDTPLEQTFVPQRDNLTAIVIQAEVSEQSQNPTLNYYLMADNLELAKGEKSLTAGRHDYLLRFSPQRHSEGTQYTLRLELDAPTSASVRASFEDEYEVGHARQGSQSLGNDLTFKFYYRYTPLMLLTDTVALFRNRLEIVLLVIALFCLPGLALLSLLPPSNEAPNSLEELALAVSLSVSLSPILLSLVTWAGGQITPVILWGWLMGCALVGGWRLWTLRHRLSFRSLLPDWDKAMLGLLIAGIVIVFSAAREVRYPLWTDSYHHTVITQLIIEKGQIPTNYLPYYPIEQFTYHFGFHTMAAFLSQLAQMEAPQSVIVTGQMLIALTGLTVYMMVTYLTGSRHIAFFAAVTVLILNHVPGFYINWGRYTQLAGQMILPVFIVVVLQLLYRRPSHLRWLLGAIILGAGLFFIHYRVIFFGFMFILAYTIIHFRELILTKERAWLFMTRAAGLALGVLLLISPWLVYVSQNLLAKMFLPVRDPTTLSYVKAIAQEAVGVDSYYNFSLPELFHQGLTPLVFALASLGLLVGWQHNHKLIQVILLWLILLIAGANSHHIGPGLYSMVILTIGLYIPASLLAGLSLAKIWEMWLRVWAKLGSLPLSGQTVGSIILAIVLTLFGLQRVGITLLENGFVRPADEKAMAWIGANTPTSALFLVNSIFWQPTAIEGRDAGWWLPLLANRATTVPLHRYRDDSSAEFVLHTNRLARRVEDFKSAGEALQFLKQNNIQYIYIGSRPSRWTAKAFKGVTGYRLVYHGDGTWIFAIE